MKKLFLWTFVVTLLCTWAVAGADQTPTTPTTSSMAPAGDLDAIKAEKDKAAQEILSGKDLLSDVAPAKLAVPRLEKEKAEAEIQQAGPALIQLRVPDPDVILLVNDKTGIASPAGTTPGGDVALVEVCPPNSMYSAPPHGPSDAWSAGTSDVAFQPEDYLRYDNFSNATGDICDIHWWGMSLHFDAGWYACEEDPYAFEIIFYPDDGAGKPDTLNPVYTYSPAVPARTNTGDLYAGFPLYRYDMILDPCVQGLVSGWVSIRGISIDPVYDCAFLWMSSPVGDGQSWFRNSGFLDPFYYNLSMCITGEYVETYGACCDDETGICTDDIEQLQCPQPLRFAGNTLCAALDPPCGEIPGACCFEDGSCIEMTASECADAQGVYYGEGTVCDPNPCPQPSIYPCMDAQIIYWDNGDTDGSNGLSMLSGAGQYRSILDDFIVEEEILLTDFHQTLLWNSLQPPQAEGYDLILWTDVAGAPGVPIMTLNATLISEVLTGRVWFGRNEFVVTVFIEPTVIPAGTYWLEMHILETGGENAFCMAQSPPNILLNPVYVIYEDMTGPDPVPGYDVFAADYGVNFCLTGDPVPEDGACCFEDGSCIVMFEEECIGAGGIFWGLGTTCDPNPCPGPCDPDFSVVAPVENATGTTCGAGDDCDLRAGEDIIYEVEIPNDGEWNFSLCDSDFDTYMFVGTTCCGQEVGYNDDFCGLQSQVTAYVTAGTYYVDIEGYSGCGNYVFNVFETQACVVECPPGGTIEPEPCGEDTNGGCGAAPPTYEFGTVSCEETMCGTAWADNGTRDTDWFELDLAEATIVTVTGEAEFPYQLGIITPGDPDPCVGYVVNALEQAPECVVLTISASVGPGIVWIWAGDAGFYDNPCGNDDDDYYFTVSCGGCEDYMTVEIMTDEWPSETTWEMIERAGGTVVASAGPLSDPWTLHTWQVCGDPGLCYDWYIYDSYGDGICCDYGDGYYNIYDFTGALVCTGGVFGAMDACEGIGQCVPPVGACCIDLVCEFTSEEQPCLDAGGDWYVGETCPEFDCPTPPIDCDDAVYHNGNSIGGAFASQCDTEYPMQAEVCDDFILPGDVPIEVTSIVGGMGFWNRTPPADPSELESVIFDIYNDAGGVPGGNPVDMDPDCAREGDIVWTHEYAQGQFGYMEEPAGYWRIWVEVAPGELTLQPGVTYWIGWAGRHFFSTTGQGGPQPTDQLTGSPCLLYFPLLGYDVWTDVWGQDIGFCINGIPSGPPPCDYIPGDCNHSGVALELADVIAMIGMYRGTVTPAYTCDCPPHGATFAPEADPNGNCVALELADVVAEIAAYRGTGIAYGCVDCPGDGPPPPLLGKEGTSVIPSLKSKVKTTQQGSAD